MAIEQDFNGAINKVNDAIYRAIQAASLLGKQIAKLYDEYMKKIERDLASNLIGHPGNPELMRCQRNSLESTVDGVNRDNHRAISNLASDVMIHGKGAPRVSPVIEEEIKNSLEGPIVAGTNQSRAAMPMSTQAGKKTAFFGGVPVPKSTEGSGPKEPEPKPQFKKK